MHNTNNLICNLHAKKNIKVVIYITYPILLAIDYYTTYIALQLPSTFEKALITRLMIENFGLVNGLIYTYMVSIVGYLAILILARWIEKFSFKQIITHRHKLSKDDVEILTYISKYLDLSLVLLMSCLELYAIVNNVLIIVEELKY